MTTFTSSTQIFARDERSRIPCVSEGPCVVSVVSTVQNKLSGFLQNLAFSNRWSVIIQRLLHPSYPVVAYLWKSRWWIICDTRCQDARAAKEVLAGGCYDAYIARSAHDGRLSYVNIGAHIGTFDIAVASHVAEVPFACSVEMNPATFARLNFNLHLNRQLQVRTVNAGVGGVDGTTSVRATGCSLADNLFVDPTMQVADVQSFTVPIWTLGKVLEKAGAHEQQFDLLKVDCEGAEYAIIEESSTDLLRRFRNVVMELHPPPSGCSVDRLCKKMEHSGFRAVDELASKELRFWTRSDP